MLNEDIDLVDIDMNRKGVWSNHREAWYRLKQLLELTFKNHIKEEKIIVDKPQINLDINEIF